MPVIVKAHDDLRQEQFTSQLLQMFASIFRVANVPVWMRPYDILATSASGGLIHAVPDTISIDALKRGDPHFTTLDDWFDRHFNFGARGADFAAVCAAADSIREGLHGARVSYAVNRNINYTNVCYFRCNFCAFSKGKGHEDLRGTPYDIEDAELARRVTEAWERGATEVWHERKIIALQFQTSRA